MDWQILQKEDIRAINDWYKNPSLKGRYGSPDGTEKLIGFIAVNPHRYAWVVWDQKEMIGLIDLEITEGIGWIGLIVNPLLHNQGYGRRILKELLERPELKGVQEIRTGIEPDNEPSLRCFRAAGFEAINTEPDAEEMLNFRYVLAH